MDVPEVNVESVTRPCLGTVHVALVADPGTTTPLDVLQKKYMDACAEDLPIGMELIVTIQKPPFNSP